MMNTSMKIGAAAFALALAATFPAIAKAPAKGTSYADCKANAKEWRWIGTPTKGKCFRKVGQFLKDVEANKAKKK